MGRTPCRLLRQSLMEEATQDLTYLNIRETCPESVNE